MIRRAKFWLKQTQARLGDRQPRTIPTKDLPHQVVVFFFWGGGGVLCELSVPKFKEKGKICTTPSFQKLLHSRC